MSIASRLTVTPLLYACGILFALLLVSTGTARYFHGEMLDAQKAQTDAKTAHDAVVGGLNLRISELGAANTHEHSIVEELARRLVTAVGQRQQAGAALTDAITQRDRARRERDRAHSLTRKAQEANYENDETCADWGARPVCGGISDGLYLQWERARGSDGAGGEDGAGGNPGAAAGADRSDPDRGPHPRTGADAGMDVRDRGLRPAGRLFQQSPVGSDAVGRTGLGRELGGQPARDQAGQRGGAEAAGTAGHRETAVTSIVLTYPDHIQPSTIFDALYKAGAASAPNGSHPTVAVLAGGSSEAQQVCAAVIRQRLAQRGIQSDPRVLGVLYDRDGEPELLDL